jgi:hypothetical protein
MKMKKGLFIFTSTLILVLFCSTGVWAENTLKVGYSFHGELSNDSGTSKVNPGFDVTLEHTNDAGGFECGFGAEYQFPRTATNNDTKFYFIPVYAIFACEIAETEFSQSYLVGKFGYNFFKVKGLDDELVDGGMYYGFGLKMNIANNVRAEALYEVNRGSLSDVEITNKAYVIRLGFAF